MNPTLNPSPFQDPGRSSSPWAQRRPRARNGGQHPALPRNLTVGAGSERASYTIRGPDVPDAGRGRYVADGTCPTQSSAFSRRTSDRHGLLAAHGSRLTVTARATFAGQQ